MVLHRRRSAKWSVQPSSNGDLYYRLHSSSIGWPCAVDYEFSCRHDGNEHSDKHNSHVPMNFIIKGQRAICGRRPVHYRTLPNLLVQFGIAKCRNRNGGEPAMFPKRRGQRRRSLWEIFELVRARWKELRWLHPDVSGGSHELFAVMSAIHDVIMLRLKRKGICA